MPLARADDDAFLEVGFRVAAIAIVALVAALVLGWSSLVPAALLLLGGMYGAELAIDDAPLDAATPLVAAGLLVTAELGYWAIEEREPVRADPGEGLRRVAFVAVVGLGALLVASLLLALVDVVRADGLAIDLIGAAAAAAALLAVVVFTRRRDETAAREQR
ncbi:MAG: hypothetical protein H0U08_06615 [Actinobacteria bacterium]|nr:hypothetical protein [Actinomycetota bacterium]